MAYATLDDLAERTSTEELIRLTDRATPPAGVIDVARVTQVLDGASALADSYLAARYPIPAASTPALRDAVISIARADLYTSTIPDKVAADRQTAIAWLRDVAAGRAVLPGQASATAPARGDAAIAVSGEDHRLDRASLEGF